MEQLAMWAPALVSAVAAIYVYGRLTEKVNGHDKRLDKVETHVEQHERELAQLHAATHKW